MQKKTSQFVIASQDLVENYASINNVIAIVNLNVEKGNALLIEIK